MITNETDSTAHKGGKGKTTSTTTAEIRLTCSFSPCSLPLLCYLPPASKLDNEWEKMRENWLKKKVRQCRLLRKRQAGSKQRWWLHIRKEKQTIHEKSRKSNFPDDHHRAGSSSRSQGSKKKRWRWWWWAAAAVAVNQLVPVNLFS